MENILSDPKWQGIGAIAAIIVAFIIYKLQEKKKKLSYKELFSGQLLSVNEQIKNDLKITYKDIEIAQLNLLKIKIINDGNVPIKKDDFNDEPIKLSIKNIKNVISQGVMECNPVHLDVKSAFSPTENKIMISPLLLNPNDSFNIQIIFDGNSTSFDLTSRIEDISKITIFKSKKDIANSAFSYIIASLTLIVVGGFIIYTVLLILYIIALFLNEYAAVPTPVSMFIFIVAILSILYIKRKNFW